MGKWFIVANPKLSHWFINNQNLKMLWSIIWHLDLWQRINPVSTVSKGKLGWKLPYNPSDNTNRSLHLPCCCTLPCCGWRYSSILSNPDTNARNTRISSRSPVAVSSVCRWSHFTASAEEYLLMLMWAGASLLPLRSCKDSEHRSGHGGHPQCPSRSCL